MIQAATKYAPLKTRQPREGVPQVLVPTISGARLTMEAWFHRELKDGGFLFRYLKREKEEIPEQIRKVARIMQGFVPNHKCDIRRLAAIPARVYMRWKLQDKHFWSDDNNLRSLKRSEPDMPIYVEPRQLPQGRFHKTYEVKE